MGFVAGRKARMLVGDFHLAAYGADMRVGWSGDMLDATVFTTTGAKDFIAGQDTSTLSLSGYYDTAEHADLAAWKTAAAQAVTYAPSGLAHSSELVLVSGLETEFTTDTPVAGLSSFSLNVQTDGQTDYGVSLADLAAVTADTNGTSHDGSAATSGGGVAHLHVTAFSGFTSVAVTVQDSADNSSWATIGTFTTATGVTGERLAIAGTIRRYTRCVFDVTGSGSATCQVGLARR